MITGKKALGIGGVLCFFLTVLWFFAQQEKKDDMKDNLEKGENLQIESTISIEESVVTISRKIDQQLNDEAESGNYTWENPFIVRNPYQNSPLTALILFQTEEETSVKVTVLGEEPLSNDDFSSNMVPSKIHRVPIIGLYAGTENQVMLELLDTKGNRIAKQTVTIQTDPLPEKMQDLVKIYEKGENTALPLILVTGQQSVHPFAFDKNGDIRWYLSEKAGSYGIFPISGGKFIFQDREIMIPTYEKPHTTHLYEMDYLGRCHKIYYVENGWHHDIIEKEENGNFLMLSSSIDGHVEDVVLELDRKTGEIVKKLDLRELFGTTYVDRIDWAHCNTVDYNDRDNSLLLSPRNLHSVIKIDWDTNELLWILADPKFWEGTRFEDKVLTPQGDIIWHYQQHSAYQIEDIDGNPETIELMLFDNHWQKTRKIDFFDGYTKSYVTQYTIDEKNQTVRQDHLYGGVKSKITSNYVLELEKSRVFFMGGYLDPVIEKNKGMIYEFTYDTEEVVNQYGIKNTFYRAYGFKPKFDFLESEMSDSDTWTFGQLKMLQKVTEQIEIPDEKEDILLEKKIVDNVLYLKGKDHQITEVVLSGEKGNYQVKYTDTLPGEELYENVSYFLPVPLSNLEADIYDLVLNVDGTWINTGETIKIG